MNPFEKPETSKLVLITDPFENSETRFASVIELIGKICDFME